MGACGVWSSRCSPASYFASRRRPPARGMLHGEPTLPRNGVVQCDHCVSFFELTLATRAKGAQSPDFGRAYRDESRPSASVGGAEQGTADCPKTPLTISRRRLLASWGREKMSLSVGEDASKIPPGWSAIRPLSQKVQFMSLTSDRDTARPPITASPSYGDDWWFTAHHGMGVLRERTAGCRPPKDRSIAHPKPEEPLGGARPRAPLL